MTKIIDNIDYKKYDKIKEISDSFEQNLINKKIKIEEIKYNKSKYKDDYYKTVTYKINKLHNITLKFNENQNLMSVYESALDKDKKIKEIISTWNYWKFNKEEIKKIHLLNNNEITINNYKIIDSNWDFEIDDPKYQK